MLCLRAAAVAALTTLAAATDPSGNTHLGCNAGGFAMGRNVFFADLVKQSIFGSVVSPTTQNVSVDAAGWPTEDFALLMYNEPGGFTYPAADLSGVYTLTASGCATVSVPAGYPGATVLNASCTGGSLLAYVAVSADTALVAGRLALLFTNTSRGSGGGGLTRVSFLQPGYPAGTDPETLTPAALAQFRRCSVIRFLGWTLVGHTQWADQTPPTTANWSARAHVGQPSYVIGGWGISGSGAPWETAAALCNAVGADMWVNVPSSADEAERDDYITRLVELLDGVLAPGARIFVEYGNECFFGNNQCYADDEAVANATVLFGGDPHRLNLGLPSPPNVSYLTTWGARMYAWTCLHIAALAGQVVGPARVGRADTLGVRVVPVLGAQGGYAKDFEEKASWLWAAWGSPPAQGLATVNIGAYVGSGVNKSDPSLTPDAVIAGFEATLANMSTAAPQAYGSNALAAYAASAAHWGMVLHAYEGGPDTSGGTAPTLMALANACADPRMADIVADIVANWQSWGGGTFNFFIISAQPLEQPWGSYSNLWDMRNATTPKSAGLDRVVSTPPAPVTGGWPLPLVNHSAAFYVGYYTADRLPPTNPVVSWLPPGTVLPYLVQGAGACSLGLNVTVRMSNANKAGPSDPLGVTVAAALPMQNVSIAAPLPTGVKWGVSTPALFPPLPPAASIPNGLAAVRLHVVTPVAPDFDLLGLDVSCRTS